METFVHTPTGKVVVIVGVYGDSTLRYVSTNLNTVPHAQDRKDCFDADLADLKEVSS